MSEQLRTFVDLNPEFETPVERLATWLARLDDDLDEERDDDTSAPDTADDSAEDAAPTRSAL